MEPMTAPRLPVAPVPTEPTYRSAAGRVVASVYPAVTLDEELLIRTEQGGAAPTPPIPSDPGVASTWDDLEGSLDPTPEPLVRVQGPAVPTPARSGLGRSIVVAAAFVTGAVGAGAVAAALVFGTVLLAGGATAYLVTQGAAADTSDATFIIMPENRPAPAE